MLTLILISVIVGLCTCYFGVKWMRWSKMPPGPWGVPLLGYAPFLDIRAPYKTLADLSKKYGRVFTISMAGVDQVIMSDWELIRDTFNKMEFHHRPDFLLFILAAQGHNGVIAASGRLWQDNRRFVMRTLRDFGFGKTALDRIITQEAESVVKTFAKHEGKPFDVDFSLNIAILNIIWNMCAAEQFDLNNPEARKIMEGLGVIQRGAAALGPLQFHPSLIPFFPKFNKILNEVKSVLDSVIKVMQNQIDDHKKTMEDGSPRDLIDAYLQEREKMAKNGEDISSFADLQLRVNIQALFIAGSDTTATTIRWALLYLGSNPDVQRKCQEEIDRVVGKDRLPSLELDKDKLPYLEAVIHEVQRLANVAPMGVPHAADGGPNSLIGPYSIPAGTWVIPNIYACHMDEKYWPNPTKFDPTRFLNEDGTHKEKVPSFLPFALGKRQCLGESLAKMELVLFLAVFLQKFEFRFPDDEPVPDPNAVERNVIIRKPPSFRIRAIERK